MPEPTDANDPTRPADATGPGDAPGPGDETGPPPAVSGDETGPPPAVLAGRRVLIVGASSGIGHALALAAADAGARVAAGARRTDLLDALAATARRGSSGGAVLPFACDVRDATAVAATVARAVDALDGLDALVYATGVNHLALLADTTAEDWERLVQTNLIGAAMAMRAALPALRDAGGRIAVLSSDSVMHPFPALGAYAASKAALETMATAWRQEEPAVHIARIVIGPTLTSMASGWDPALSAQMFERWAAEGRFDEVTPVEPALVAEHLVAWLADSDPPDEVDLYTLLGKGG